MVTVATDADLLNWHVTILQVMTSVEQEDGRHILHGERDSQKGSHDDDSSANI